MAADPTRIRSQAPRRDLAILNTVAQALNASADLTGSLAVALARVAELLGLRTGWVLLLDETAGEPYLAAARSQVGDKAWAEAWEEGRSMIFEEAIAYALEKGAGHRSA